MPRGNGNTHATSPTLLRRRAEELLLASPTSMAAVPVHDVQALIHELQVYQTELEIQNEELRRAQVELQASRDRYSELFDLAPVGYFMLDRQGTILETNLTAPEILHADRSLVVNQPLSKFMVRDQADLLYLHLHRVFETERKHVCELQLFRQDERPCDVRLESVRVNTADPPQCRTIMSDITELTLAQDAAQRSQRLAGLGTLAAGVAHEVNNPLWMISLQAEEVLAANRPRDRDRIVDVAMHEIIELVDRAGKVVKSVLRIANQEATEKHPQSLHKVLAHARDYTREHAAIKRVSVQFDVPQQMPAVTVSQTEMEQAIVNLLANAIEASPAGANILVAASWDRDYLKLRIEDKGCGISSKEMGRIFDPFYTTRRHDGGTGLGLNVANRVIEDHHGTLEVSSVVDQGTTIVIRLPITQDTAEGKSDEQCIDR